MNTTWLHVMALGLPLVLFGFSLWSMLACSRKASTAATRRAWLVLLTCVNGLSWAWNATLLGQVMAKGSLDTETLRVSLTVGVPLFICLMLPVLAQAWSHRKA